MQGLTLQQLQQMGATPITPPQPTGQGLTLAQLQQMGAKPVQPVQQTQPNLGDKTAATFQQGANNIISDIKKTPVTTNFGENLLNVFKTGGNIAGDIAGTAANFVGNIVSPLIPNKVQEGIGSAADFVSNKVDQIPGMTPDIKQGLGNVFNTVSLLGGDTAIPKELPGAKTIISDIKGTVNNVINKVTAPIADSVDSLASGIESKIAPSVEETINARRTGLQKIADKYSSTTNALEAAKGKGFDPIADIASDDRFIPSVDTDGTVDASMAIKKLNDFVKPLAQVERQAIEAEGKSVSFDKFANDVRNTISNLKERGSSYDTISNKIESDLKVYKEHFVKDGKIDLTKLDDIKDAKYQIANWNNEDAQIADKSVARVARQTIIDNVSNADIQKLNSEMSRYYSARDFLDSIDGKKVAGGRLGKYFARTIGGVAGSHFGILGTLAGGYMGDLIQGGLMQDAIDPYFGKKGNITPTPKSFETTKAMLDKPKLTLPGPISNPNK